MIKNTSKGRVLAGSYKICDNILSKGIGLMFRTKPSCIVFNNAREVNVPLHMFFVFFPIDVLWLDAELKVVHVLRDFRPFSSYNPKTLAKYVVEVPAGSIHDTEIGDKIWFDQI